MRRQDFTGNSKGLSLIEVLIAAAILAVALLAIASMFPISMEDMEESGKQTRGFALAEGMMERIRATGTFGEVLLYDGHSTTEALYNTGSAVVDANLDSWKQATTQVPGSGIPQGVGTITVTAAGTAPARLATVTVTVTWPNRRGISAVLVTQVSET
jgi:prepilin-type N-terminal cleavage/methylation domain-containing protein